MIKEELLHFLWRHKRLPIQKLKSTTGKTIDLLHFGYYNDSSGPDFSEGKIHYDGITWIGAIEMHVNSSDWLLHKHQNDSAYNNVILHVVWRHDKEIYIDNQPIPCLELSSFIEKSVVLNYQKLMDKPFDIPCFQYEIDNFNTDFLWMRDKLLVERLSRKIASFYKQKYLDKEVFLGLFCMAFGGNKNKIAFESFFNKIAYKQLLRWRKEPDKITCYLLGISNLFPEKLHESNYGITYKRIQHNHQLTEMNSKEWKSGAVRPKSQPKNRMLTLIQFLAEHNFNFVNNTDAASYFSAASKWLKKLELELNFSPFLCHSILINAVIPFAFFKGKKMNDSNWLEMTLDKLHAIKAENNSIVNRYKNKGIKLESAADTQAILEWYKYYCSQKKCLSCTVGQKLVK